MNGLLRTCAIVLVAGGFLSAGAGHAATLGFVVTDWDNALYETKYMEECPDGLAIGSDEIWFEGLSPADKDKLTQGGTLLATDPARQALSYLRGRHGEDVCWNPEAVAVPPPRMHIVKGKISYGMNLDGVGDGATTSKTCAHQNFTSPTGETGIDNQLYRLIGCIYGFRAAGYIGDHANRERRDEGQGNILIEVTGVDDPRNDPDVTVRFFVAETPLPHDTAGKIMPFSSYRIRAGRYGDTAHGRIVDGVLETDPAEIRLPAYGNDGAYEMRFRDLRLKLTVAADGATAKGMWAGYYDFDSFWDGLIKVEHDAHVGEYDCPSIYQTAKQLADGFPDPKTGQCTALSSAFRMEAVAAFVIHDQQTARAP